MLEPSRTFVLFVRKRLYFTFFEISSILISLNCFFMIQNMLHLPECITLHVFECCKFEFCESTSVVGCYLYDFMGVLNILPSFVLINLLKSLTFYLGFMSRLLFLLLNFSLLKRFGICTELSSRCKPQDNNTSKYIVSVYRDLRRIILLK